MNDTTNCVIIIIIFGFLFYYLAIVLKKMKVIEKTNKKICDPIQLFLHSLNQDVNDSINSFKNCVNLYDDQKVVHRNKNTKKTFK